MPLVTRTTSPESALEGTEVVLLSDKDVHDVFAWDAAIEALRNAYSAPVTPAMMPRRTVASAGDVWLRTMSAIDPSQNLMGTKSIAVSVPDRRASYLISLFDTRTTSLRAVIDGHAVTGYRTAATSALAIDALVPHRPLRVALIGSGAEAAHHLDALHAVRAVRDVRVYSPTASKRSRFVQERIGASFAIHAAASPIDAVRDADLIICAARARDEQPTLRAGWLTRDAVIVSIGSTTPEQREVDADIIERASVIVADAVDDVVDGTGDMLAARAAGIPFEHKLRTLFELVSGRCSGGEMAGTILYKSTGAALQDVAVAGMCLRRALVAGCGTPITRGFGTVSK